MCARRFDVRSSVRHICNSNCPVCWNSAANKRPVFRYIRQCRHKPYRLRAAYKMRSKKVRLLVEGQVESTSSLRPSNLLVALITIAVVAGQCVNALVTTLMYFHFSAFVHVTVGWFIRLVGAVNLLVAHQLIVDTCDIAI